MKEVQSANITCWPSIWIRQRSLKQRGLPCHWMLQCPLQPPLAGSRLGRAAHYFTPTDSQPAELPSTSLSLPHGVVVLAFRAIWTRLFSTTSLLSVFSACPSHVPHVTCFQAPPHTPKLLLKCCTMSLCFSFQSNTEAFEVGQTSKESSKRNTSLIFNALLLFMSPKITPIFLVITCSDSCQV